ncbi:hypothetical protein ACHAXR_011149 [Thalassiosira sp. AJA248-18]
MSSTPPSSTTATATTKTTQPSAIFPIHIIGGGSIGLLYASAMHCAYNEVRVNNGTHHNTHDLTNPVTLLMRSHHKTHLKLWLGANNDQTWLAPVTVSRVTKDNNGNCTVLRKCNIPVELIGETKGAQGATTNHLPDDGHSPIKCLLLCTKANDAIPALNSVWDRLILSSPPLSSSPTKVIIMSNGALAIRDAIYKHFDDYVVARQDKQTFDGGPVQIVLATTTHGAYQSTNNGDNNVGKYNIVHAGEGSTHCTNNEFAGVCRSIGWESAALSDLDMSVMLWKKLAVNCVINPLTAIHDVKNGQLLKFNKHMEQDIKVITRHILEEVSSVAMMEMESLFEGNDNKTDSWLQSTREQLSVPRLEQFVLKVMSDTSDNISSMLQDVRARRTTEVRFLSGYVASLGQDKYGVKCPTNMEMCRLVEELMP